MRALPVRLGPKINVALVLFMLLLAAAVALLVLFGFRRTQDSATRQSEQGLEAQGRDSLLANVHAQAFVSEAQFAATGGIGREAASYMIDIRSRGGSVPWDSNVLRAASDGQLYDPRTGRRTDVRVPAGLDASLAGRDLTESAALDAIFPTLLANVGGSLQDANFGAVSAYFTSVNGVTRYYPRVGGGARQAPAVARDVAPQANPDRDTMWSAPYQDPTGPGLVVTASTPVYEGDEYRGFIGVDLSLQRLIEQINQVKPTASGFAFFMTADGSILRTSSYDEVQAAAADGRNTAFAQTLDAMRGHQSGVDRATLGGREMFVAYAPVNEVGGTFALAAPVDEVTAQSTLVNAAIQRSGNQTLIFTLASLAAFFVLALAGVAWLNRRMIVQPISSLVKGTQAVAGGDLTTRIPVQSLDELGMLADSFNQMTQQIAQRRDRLREEIAERERTSEALRASESTYRTMARNFPNGVVTVYDRDLRYVLADGSALTAQGATPADLVGKTIFEALSPRMVAVLEPRYRAALEGETSVFELPARGRVYRTFAVPLRAEDGEILAGMAMTQDVTEQVETERMLEQGVADRTRELQTLLEVSRRVASTIELQPLLRIVFEQVKTVAPYDRASFMLREGDRLTVRALDLPPDDDQAAHARARFRVRDGEPLWDAIKQGSPVLIDDVQGDSPLARAYQDAVGARIETAYALNRSWLGVPLRLQDRVIGMLALSTERAGAFDARQAQLATAIARQAAFAVENSRLFEQAEQRTRELQTLLEVTRHVGSTLELLPLAHRILEETHEVVAYDRSTFMLAEGATLRVIAVVSADGAPDDSLTQQVGEVHRIGGPPLIWDNILAGQPVIVDDTHAATALAQAYREATGEKHVARSQGRSWMAVPLMSQGRLDGVMLMTKRTPGFFTQHAGELALAIASQAAAGLANARLFEETQSRTRELTALLDISTSVASTLDLDPLLATLLEQVSGVVAYDLAAFALVDGDELQVVAVRDAHGPPDRPFHAQIGRRHRAQDGGLLWDGVRARRPLIIEDVRGDTPHARAYREIIGGREVAASRANASSWMSVPLESKGVVIGLLALVSSEPASFSARDARLAGAVANQAAIGIDNARLFKQSEQRTRELSTVVGVSHAVASTLQLQELVTLILDQLEQITGYTGASLLMLDGDDLVMLETRRAGELVPEATGMRFPTVVRGDWWRAVTRGGPLIIGDVLGDSPDAVAYREAMGQYLHMPLFAPIRSWLAVSLAAQDRPIGLLTMSHTAPGFFTGEQARVAAAVADQAALAIENARLYERVQTTAALEERQRLARELHDSVSQALYGIALGARTAETMLQREPARVGEPIEYILSLAEAGLAEMRALIFELRPESLETEGLVAALDKQVAATRARYGVAVDAVLGAEPDAPIEMKEAVYRVAQEALHNTVKHARATDVVLRLASENGSMELDIRDNGIGFDPGGDFPGHLGLKSMRERVERLRGTLQIESAPGEGTRISASIPLH